ncbi:MAG TPA: alpha/beta hydrolase [Actinomycetes bacterium]|nr:alpha/beta hydrolase [Actinomycetes bacterium]
MSFPTPEDRTVVGPDGAVISYTVSGPEGALPVVVHHGTPGSASPSREWLRSTAEHGLRLVTYERGGYGGSSRRPGRRVVDCAGDVVALLDAIGAEVCLTYGRSGGGPHALATAALLPERVLAAASVAGVAPFGGPGMSREEWLAGMGEDNVEEFDAALAGEDVLRPWLEAQRPAMLSLDQDAVTAAMHSLLPQVDLAVFTGEFAEDTLRSFARALAPGVDGWLDDDLEFTRDWGFDLTSIEPPVALWQGSADLMVPFAHGQWLADHVSGAEVHLVEGEGHWSIPVAGPDGVLAGLLRLAGR